MILEKVAPKTRKKTTYFCTFRKTFRKGEKTKIGLTLFFINESILFSFCLLKTPVSCGPELLGRPANQKSDLQQ